jgi:diacylglycerol kinase
VAKKNKNEHMKIVRSFGFALEGIKRCFITEINFKIHIGFSIAALLLGWVLKISIAEWGEIIFCIGLVLSMEMMNTAIEALCNIVHQPFHPAIKKVKDIAAGAVLLVAVSSFIIAIVILLPKIIAFIKLL